MAISDSGRATNTGKFALVPASWRTQRDIDVSDSMRETLERTYSLDRFVNTRFQGRTNVAAYELKRNKTTVSIKADWDGTETQFNAKTPEQADFETMLLAWTKLRDLARVSTPQQDITEAQVDPTLMLGERLANAIVRKLDNAIWSLMIGADLTSVVWDYAAGSTRNQVLTPEGSTTNYIGPEAVKHGTDPLILPLIERFVSVLSAANQGSGQVASQQRYTFLMSMDCLIQIQRELGALRNEQLVMDEINGNWRSGAWELFQFATSNAIAKQKVQPTTGAPSGSGKDHWPIHVVTPAWATMAARDVKTLTYEPFSPGNNTMDWNSNYTAQQLLAEDDPRYIWRGFVRAEA